MANTKDVIIRTRLTQVMADRLAEKAEKEDLTISEVVRREIARYLLRKSK